MTVYTVLAPPAPSTSVEPDPLGYVFVKDGFCWPCVFYAELWMIFRRQWLVLLLYLIGLAIAFAIQSSVGGPLPMVFLVFARLFFALEANSLRRWTYYRHGYRLVGVAEGRRVGDAEVRFFHEVEAGPRRDPRQPPPARLQSALGMPIIRPSAESEVVGLFPAPSGRP